jgi:hypothetical protein
MLSVSLTTPISDLVDTVAQGFACGHLAKGNST